MTDSASTLDRPISFRDWLRRQLALAGLIVGAATVSLFVIAAGREPPIFEGDSPWRIWVKNPRGPAGRIGIAREPGGRLATEYAWAWPQSAMGVGGALASVLTIDANVPRRVGLLRTDFNRLGRFLILGETRSIGGDEWREAWASAADSFPRSHDGAARGVWVFTGSGLFTTRQRLAAEGSIVPCPKSGDAAAIGIEYEDGSWMSGDGVLQIMLRAAPVRSVVNGRRVSAPAAERWVLGRMSDDGRSFSGVDSAGATVTGTRENDE